MDGSAFLDGLVASITNILSAGYDRMFPQLQDLLSLLVGLEFMVAAIAWGLSAFHIFYGFVQKLIRMAVFVMLLTFYPILTQHFVDFCIWGGLTAGGIASGGELTVEEFQKPSTVISKAFVATAPINTFINQHTGWAAVKNILTLEMMALGALGIWVAFVIMALHLVFIQIALSMALAFGLIFIVFGAFGPLAFMAERAFGLIIASAARLGVAAVLVALMFPFVDQFFLPEAPMTPDAMAGGWLLIGSWLIAFLSWMIPAIAHGMLAAGPLLSWSNAVPGFGIFRGGSGVSHHSSNGGPSAPPRQPVNPPTRMPVGS